MCGCGCSWQEKKKKEEEEEEEEEEAFEEDFEDEAEDEAVPVGGGSSQRGAVDAVTGSVAPPTSVPEPAVSSSSSAGTAAKAPVKESGASSSSGPPQGAGAVSEVDQLRRQNAALREQLLELNEQLDQALGEVGEKMPRAPKRSVPSVSACEASLSLSIKSLSARDSCVRVLLG